MAKTEVSGKQLKDGSVELVDLAPEVSAILDTMTDSVVGLASETYVNTAVAAVQADVDAEETRALAAEAVLQGNIDDEETRALAAEATEASERTADVDAEETRALAAEAVLQGNIDDEETRALAAEATEVGDRQAADIILQGNIDTIETDYIAGDTATLASANSYTDTGVAALVNSAPAVLNTLNELALALGSDPDFATTVSGNIGAIDTRVTAAEGNITTLQTSVATKAATSSLATVATSGSYVDLTNKPTIPTDLDSLTDVTITTPAADQIIKYNGTAWVNSAAAAAGATTLDELTDVVIATPLKGHLVVHNGTNFVNSNTIETSGAAIKALIVKGAASQTANLLEIQNSSSQILNKVGSDGSLSLYDSAGANGFTLSNATGAAKIQLAAGKKFDLASTGLYGQASSFNIADEGATNAFTKGKWTLRPFSSSTSGLNIVPNFSDANFFGGVGILVPNNRYIGARLHIFNITDAANRGDADPMDNYSGQGRTSLLIHGYSNHTANHIEIQDQSNNKTFAINGQGQIAATSATHKPLVVKGFASQTANLVEVQDSAAAALLTLNSNATALNMTAGSGSAAYMRITANYAWTQIGRAYQQFGSYTGGYIGSGDDTVQFTVRMGAALDAEAIRVDGKTAGSTLAPRVGIGEKTITAGAQLNVTTVEAARKGLIVKGSASQTANLLEFQTSAGAATAYIAASGLQLAGLTQLNDYKISKSGASSTAFGVSALAVESSPFNAGQNTAFGLNSLLKITIGFRNTAIGASSLENIVGNAIDPIQGAENTAVGYLSGGAAVAGTRNTVSIGAFAGNTTTGAQSVSVGWSANAHDLAVAIGKSANASGNGGVAIGNGSSAGYRSVGIGNGASAATDSTFVLTFGDATRMVGSALGLIGINETTPGAQLHVTSGAAARKGLIVKGAASQSANLLELQNSAATALLTVSSGGTLHAARYTETVANAFTTTLTPSTGTLTVDTSTGNAVLGTLDAAVTTWAFTNVPTENSKVTSVTAVLVGNASYTYGDACSVNGVAVTNGIMWSGGTAPTATAGTDMITFVIVKDSAGTIKVLGSATTNFS